MKKIFLYAYDHVNLGDDLFIETIVNRYPDTEFYFWTDNENKKVFQEQMNLKIIDQDSGKIKLLNKIRPSLVARYKVGIQKKCDAQVYIGGSIFMEYPTWKNIVSWWDYQSKLLPFFVLGANFGPYHTEEYRSEMDKVYAKLSDICFRDTYSKKLFKDNENVRQAPDILFSYQMPKIPKKKKQIFVSIISCEHRNLKGLTEEEYIIKMSHLINEFCREKYQIILASFCEEEGDLLAAKKIKNHIKDASNIEILSYDGQNRKNFLERMSESSYIIATRFHAMILGMVAKIPVYPVIYSDKTKNVLEDIHFKGNYADLRDSRTLTYESAKDNLIANYVVDVDKLKKDSSQHFMKLDKIFK